MNARFTAKRKAMLTDLGGENIYFISIFTCKHNIAQMTEVQRLSWVYNIELKSMGFVFRRPEFTFYLHRVLVGGFSKIFPFPSLSFSSVKGHLLIL